MSKKKNKKSIAVEKKSKNKNVVMFQLLPNQYEIDLYLCLTKVPVPTIIPYLNETLELGFDETTDIDMESDCPSTFFGLKTPRAVIVLKDWDDPVMYAPILAHELMHVVTYISSIVSIDVDHLNTSEVWAYFMSFYMAVGMELIRLHKEKEAKDADKKKAREKKAKAKKKTAKKEVKETKATTAPKKPVKKPTKKAPQKPVESDERIEEVIEEVTKATKRKVK